jgi:quercetin dioxygenase-like cupin family protein
MNQFEAVSPSVNPAEESISVGGLGMRFLLTGAHSSGSVAVCEMTVPGGKKLPAPAHSHEHYEETVYGLTGVLTWTVDGVIFEVGPGGALCIPRGAVHRFENNTEQDVKVLCVITPAVIGPEYFREMAGILSAAAGGPPDRARVVETMLRHGLKPAMPAA